MESRRSGCYLLAATDARMVPKNKEHIVCVEPISEAAGMAAAEFADAAEESRQLLVIPIHDRADHQWQHRSKRGPCDICGSRGAK